VLVVDEVSMLSAEMLECLDTALKAVRDNDKPMGGLQVRVVVVVVVVAVAVVM
jgi:ATP-dependent exoDNAse (exonuclease V) alpha subunit